MNGINFFFFYFYFNSLFVGIELPLEYSVRLPFPILYGFATVVVVDAVAITLTFSKPIKSSTFLSHIHTYRRPRNHSHSTIPQGVGKSIDYVALQMYNVSVCLSDWKQNRNKKIK